MEIYVALNIKIWYFPIVKKAVEIYIEIYKSN